MALKNSVKKQENCIWTGLLLLVLLFVIGYHYDYYFDLNDDVLMKDILAGVYTGTPRGHNIQMLWPVSAFISLLYKVTGNLPCYGLFLCICQYGSIAMVVCRSLVFCRTRWGKVLLLCVEGLLTLGLLLNQLVCVQYTVTCTMLASAAAFLFVTTDINLPAKEFIKKNIGVILLVILAFLIRSEMLLLVTPLICVAGVVKWGSEEVIFTKEHAVKYLTVIGGILIGLFFSMVCHNLAYGSDEWQKFTEYFDNRTELYDFQILPEYEPHKEFYEGIGLTESERDLLDNYNFGLSEEIDEKIVGKVATYAAQNRSAEKPLSERLLAVFGNYYRRTLYGPGHNESDFPWNRIIILSYVAVFTTAILDKEKKLIVRLLQIVWKLGFLGIMRSVLWIWLISRDRVPARISVSMYVMEFCILIGILLVQIQKLRREGGNIRNQKVCPLLMGAIFAFYGVAVLIPSFIKTDADVEAKAENNICYNALYSYLSKEENRENFYFIDVYSSVAYTEKLFENVDNSMDNYDIMGGWACKSPIWKEKLAAFGIDHMQEALISRDDVFYVQRTGKDTAWLYQYYTDQGVEIRLESVEEPIEDFEIYRICCEK